VAEFDLNLSTRPFPAYRVFNLAMLAVLIVLVLLSVWQIYGFIQFSSRARSIRDDERSARVEAESLGKHLAALEAGLDRPEAAAKLNEIGFLNSLIARKDLSWTQMFATLEGLVPETVHLVSLKPGFGPEGAVILTIQVEGRSVPDVVHFVKALEQSPVFDDVKVSVEQKRNTTPTGQAAQPGQATDVQLNLTANYFPQKERR
jgi:type IV pilus assembly PilN-like protein